MQIFIILEVFKDFSPAKLSFLLIIIILKVFKDFSPAKMFLPKVIIILEKFEDFFACKIVLAENHHHLGNVRRLSPLQSYLRRKSSLSWKYSKTFSPAKLSSTQIIIILKIFNNFFACKIVLAANHLYPENIQRFFFLQNCLRCKSSLSSKYSKIFRLQKCLNRRSSLSWKYSKSFSLQNCLCRKSSLSWNCSKTFSPAKLS